MNLFGLTPGTVLRLLREAGDPGRPGGALLVDGPLAPQLARLLADGGEPALVRAGGDPAAAAAVICVLGGAPTTEQLALLRRATRAGVPTVAVQTAPAAAEVHVPYVLAEDVVDGGQIPDSQQAAAATVGQQLGTALAVGVAARSLVRRLPFRSRVVDSLVAGGATFALGRVAARLR
jgi:hypothetical protein